MREELAKQGLPAYRALGKPLASPAQGTDLPTRSERLLQH